MTTCCLKCGDGATICCWEACFSPTRVTFESVEGSLNTGDLFLARSNPSGRSAGLNMIATSPWDHVGIIWKQEDVIYVIDSGSFRYYDFCRRPLEFGDDNTSDSTWNKGADGNGPQMYELSKFIEAQGRAPLAGVHEGDVPWYYERLGVRKLKTRLNDTQIDVLTNAINTYRDRPYQNDSNGGKGEAFKAAIDICDMCSCVRNTEENRSSLFCSELDAALYLDVGVLKSKQPANEYVPADFSRDHGCNLSSCCCCCWWSWSVARCCGCGDLQHTDGGRLFDKEIVLQSPRPPDAMCKHPKKIISDEPVVQQP